MIPVVNRGAAPIRLATALVAVLLAVAGCGSQQPEGPLGGSSDPSTSPSPSASASPSAVAEPPPVPPATDDEKGREAFARWFVEAFAYAFATNDPGAINDVAATDAAVQCRTCQLFTTYLEQRKSDGVVLRPSAYVVKKVFPTGRANGLYYLTLVTDRPAFANVKDDGTVVKRFPGDPAYPIEVALRYHDGAYELSDWTAGRKKG